MKALRQDDGGSYTAQGEMKESATIILKFTEMTLEEYRQTDTWIAAFLANMNVPTRLQKLVLNPDRTVHDGGNPAEGGKNK